jgi:hypothetical protein
MLGHVLLHTDIESLTHLLINRADRSDDISLDRALTFSAVWAGQHDLPRHDHMILQKTPVEFRRSC